MRAALLTTVALAVLAPLTSATLGPDDFPTDCGVLNQLQDGDTCASVAAGLNVTVAYLESLDATLNCLNVKAGDYICTGGLAATCVNTVTVAAGATCAEVANQNKLSLGQLIGLNTQLSAADCSFPVGGSVCIAAPPSQKECSGAVYTATANDTSASLATQFGLSSAQLIALNPDGFDASGAAVVGAQLCIGCPPQPTCGVDVSPQLSALLSANLNICALFASCQGAPYIDNSQGTAALALSVKQAGSSAISQLRITPNAFPGGDGLFEFKNLIPDLLQQTVQINLSSGLSLNEASLDIAKIKANISGGVIGRKLLREGRRLQSYIPWYYGPVGAVRVPYLVYY